METAVADIVDNSITAEARHINIRFAWNEGNPWLAVIDDGYDPYELMRR
jgi:DNA mismatch repair ATPase MutL